MNSRLLSNALQNLACTVRNINVETAEQDQALRDAATLLRALGLIVAGMQVSKALGAPGDWGYDTPIGVALQARSDQFERYAVFDAITSERDYQDRKWGTPTEHPHEVGGYLTLMNVHLQRAQAAWAGANSDTEALAALRKGLAIGVACGEQHGMPSRPRAQAVSQQMRGDGYQRTPANE